MPVEATTLCQITVKGAFHKLNIFKDAKTKTPGIAVGDRTFLGCKILIFAQTESKFIQIYLNLPN